MRGDAITALLAQLGAVGGVAVGTRAAHGLVPGGAVLLGRGLYADAWDLGGEVLKIFRFDSAGLSVFQRMRDEIGTIIAMEATGISPMPRLLGHGVLAEAGADGSLCGWALLERAAGAPLSLAEIVALPGAALEAWKNALVDQAVALEACLDAAVPLACWEESYAGIRLRRLDELARDGRVGAADAALARELAGWIGEHARGSRFVHGDFNPPNIVYWAGRLVVIDPFVTRDPPEANWRHFTLVPGLAEDLAARYAARTGYVADGRMIAAVGAMTHLYTALVSRDTSVMRVRRDGLARCLSELGMARGDPGVSG